MSEFETDLYYDYLIRVAVQWKECGHSWIDAHELMNEYSQNMGLNFSREVINNLLTRALVVWINKNDPRELPTAFKQGWRRIKKEVREG